MANRKGKLKAVGLIAVGFLTGSILVGGLVAWRYLQMFKQQYYTGILSNAHTAYMIRANLEEELLKNIEGNIQQCVVSVDSLWGNDENRLGAFWYVQRYYEKYKLPVPDNIKSILVKLPEDLEITSLIPRGYLFFCVGHQPGQYTCQNGPKTRQFAENPVEIEPPIVVLLTV